MSVVNNAHCVYNWKWVNNIELDAYSWVYSKELDSKLLIISDVL